MFAVGIVLCIMSLVSSGLGVFVLIDGFSTYFWQEPTLILLLFGSLAVLALSIFLMVKSETWEDIAFWFEEKKEIAAYKKFVKKYQAPEHFTHPHRKDLQRLYGSESKKAVYDMRLRAEFNLVPSNAYYRFLDREDPYVKIASADEWVRKLHYKWDERLEELESYAEQGYNAARVALYQIYYHGVKKENEKDFIEKNEKKALKYLNAAVKSGYVHAQEQLVWMALGEKDYEKAQALIGKYGLQGTYIYYMYWGEAYYYGYGVSVDYQKALAYFEKANLWGYTIQCRVACLKQLRRFGEALAICRDLMKMNDAWGIAQYSGLLSAEFGKHHKAFRIVKRAYKKGCNAEGVLFRLAYCYADGLGCKKDVARAVELYQILADKNDTAAINNLAAIYSKESAYEAKDVFALYLKAADLGDERAMANVGWAYLEGKGVAKDEKKAFAYFQKSAELGDVAGISALGRCYENGWGVAKNVKKAIEIWRKAEYYEGCQYRLGSIHYDMKQYAEAKKYFLAFLATIERKNIIKDWKDSIRDANFCLGYIYSQERFYETALEYYKVAADYGNATAMHNIGVFYENGWGVEKDWETAKYWYARAKENGYKASK